VTLTVQLDWKPNAQFAGLLVTQHLGWFADAGLDVRIRPWVPGTDPLDRVPHEVGTIAVSEDNLAIRAAALGHRSGTGITTTSSPFLTALTDQVRAWLAEGTRVVLAGDANVAPTDSNVFRIDMIAVVTTLAARLDTIWIDHVERGGERPSDPAALITDFHGTGPPA
jgi:hypothetical protein